MIPAELCIALCALCLAAGVLAGKAAVRLELRTLRRQLAERERQCRLILGSTLAGMPSHLSSSVEETARNRLRYEQRPKGPRDPDAPLG